MKISALSPGGHAIIRGMSESHLETVCDRVSRELQIEINIGGPKVIYVETIRRSSEAEGKYIRQTGGSGNYGHVKLRLEPGEPGSGYQFCSEIREGQIPPEFIEPVIRGALGAASGGILAGYEMVDLRAILCDGSYHTEDSNAMAFTIAGSIAFKEAACKASPIVLEPVMSVEAVVPEKSLGAVVGDLNRRRGRIEGMERQNAAVTIHAIVPLAEVLGSSSHGRLNYPMRFARYEPAPRRGWNGSDGVGVTANKPESPRTGRGFATADQEATPE